MMCEWLEIKHPWQLNLDNEIKDWDQRMKKCLKNDGFTEEDMVRADAINFYLSQIIGYWFSHELNFKKHVREQNIIQARQVLELLHDLDRINVLWSKKISEAIKNGGFTKLDKILARDWENNPFAERLIDNYHHQSRSVPYEWGLTEEAKDMAHAFAKYVNEDDLDKVEQCYNEMMTMELIWEDDKPRQKNPLEMLMDYIS